MRGIEEPALVEERPPISPRREGERAAIERPTLSAGDATRRKDVPERDGSAVRERHVDALPKASACETRRRIRRQDQHAARGDLDRGLALAAPRRSVDARGSLGGDERARSLGDGDPQPDPIPVHEAATQGAGICPRRRPVVSRRQQPQRARRVGGADHRGGARALERQHAVRDLRHGPRSIRRKGVFRPARDPAPPRARA